MWEKLKADLVQMAPSGECREQGAIAVHRIWWESSCLSCRPTGPQKPWGLSRVPTLREGRCLHEPDLPIDSQQSVEAQDWVSGLLWGGAGGEPKDSGPMHNGWLGKPAPHGKGAGAVGGGRPLHSPPPHTSPAFRASSHCQPQM